jgi:hypothetical protein
MKLTVTCMHCYIEDGQPRDRFALPRQPITESGSVRFTCDRGHSSVAVIQGEKFEILAEIAISALLDGYPRECVASFAACLERYYEYYVFLVSEARGFDAAETAKAWKLIPSSERQVGAYVWCALSEKRVAPNLLQKKQVEVRNRVTHQGVIPTEDEAVKFGQAVLDIVCPGMKHLLATYGEKVHELAVRGLRERSQEAWSRGEQTSTIAPALIVSYTKADQSTVDLAVILKARRKWQTDLHLVDLAHSRTEKTGEGGGAS